MDSYLYFKINYIMRRINGHSATRQLVVISYLCFATMFLGFSACVTKVLLAFAFLRVFSPRAA